LSKVKAVVLLWKDNEFEQLKEKFGDDIMLYPAFVKLALELHDFKGEKWKKHFYDSGLAFFVPIRYMQDDIIRILGEEWFFGVVCYHEKADPLPSKKEILDAIKFGKIIKYHPNDHEIAFKIYLHMRNKYEDLKNRIKKLVTEEDAR